MAEPNVLDAGVFFGQVMSIEHVCSNPTVPLRLQRSIVVHRHPYAVLYGSE